MKRVTTVTAAVLFAITTMAAPASAHGKAVDPPGQGEGHEAMPVSRAWAQAHCHAAAPEQATANSGGVVVFTPAGVKDCDEAPNPGGQVHPHAGG